MTAITATTTAAIITLTLSLSLILTEISILRSSSSLLERARLFLSLSFNLRENKLGNALYQKVSLLLHFDETKVVAFLSFDFE